MYNQISTQKNYQQIIEQIKSMILVGELSVGDRLPSERELAERFGVSRVCVREALKSLEVLGVAESRQGGGNYIVNNLREALSDNLSMAYFLSDSKPAHVMQLRRAMETEAVRSIIELNDPATLETLDGVIGSMNKASSFEELEPWDIRFHTTLIELSGNPLLSHLFSAYYSLYIQHIQFSGRSSSENRSLEWMKRVHAELFETLLNRDMEAAIAAMTYHFRY